MGKKVVAKISVGLFPMMGRILLAGFFIVYGYQSFKVIMTDDLVVKKYSNMMAAIFPEYTSEDMILFEKLAYFLVFFCATCKALGGLLILFDHILGYLYLICYMLITTSVRCVYYYKVGEPEFVIFLQGFMQNMTLFGAIWLYMKMKLRQLKKKNSDTFSCNMVVHEDEVDAIEEKGLQVQENFGTYHTLNFLGD